MLPAPRRPDRERTICGRVCDGRVHLVGFTRESAVVRQILEQVVEQTTAPTIATVRSPLLATLGQQLAALEAVFEEIRELEFEEKANLVRKRIMISGRIPRVWMQSRSRI